MNESPAIPVLAIDGGGTRCRVAVDDGRTVAMVETGPANVSTDFDGAVDAVGRGLDGLADRLAWSRQTLLECPAFVGLAGVTGPAIADRLRAALQFRHVRIEDDRPAAVRGALGRADGLIAHCGTGSFYAVQTGDVMRFAGGWGSVLGDEASAQWIGRAALGATLETVDGRRPSSPLAARFLADFADSAGIVRFAGRARPSEFGALAQLVTDFATRGDPLAQSVMRAGADEIVRSLTQLGWVPGLSICLTGGIGPHYLPYLPPEMRSRVAEPIGAPLDGALSLARDLAKDIAHERR